MAEPSPPSEKSLFRAVPALPVIFGFIIFNVMSFQIALGTPLVLLARHWGGSPFYIGALASLVPLLTTLQIYMAPRVEYIGFRRVMLSGWTGRNVILVLIALLPFCSRFVSSSFQLEALFAFMLLYNFLRGLASSSWLPWLTALVPEPMRGRYFSADQFTCYLSSAATFYFCGKILGDQPGDLQFGIIFTIALLSGWISLYFLKAIDSPPPKEGNPTLEPFLVWARRIWRIPAFRRLIRVNIMFSLAIAAWEPFTTLFMRDQLHVSERIILYISAVKTLGAVGSAWAWGLLADRFSSRPVMALSSRIILVTMFVWLLLATGIYPTSTWFLMAVSVVFQIGILGFVISNLRYCMNDAAKDYPVLALTLFSVLTSLANALAPNLWGAMLSTIEDFKIQLGIFRIDQYTCFYAIMIMLIIGMKMLIHRLPDQKASATHIVLYHMINDYPLRTINAVYQALFHRGKAD